MGDASERRKRLDDEEYLRALESGDMVESERIIRSRAKDQGYDVRSPYYHGTTHEFTVFRLDRVNVENDWGKGFYFTSDPDDAARNYAGEGPDLSSRVEQLAEMLRQENEDMNSVEAEREARRQLVGPVRRTLKVLVRLDNPAVMGGAGSTEIEGEVDDDGNITGMWGKFVDAVNEVESEFYGVTAGTVLEAAQVGETDYLWNVFKRIRGSGALDGAEDTNGQLAIGEVQRRILELMGFDGIVDRTVYNRFNGMGMRPGTTHVIAFHSWQAKLADVVTRDDAGNVIPPSRRYDPDNPDIRNPARRPREFPFEWADALRRRHPDVWDAGGNVRGNEVFRLWARRRRGERSPAIDHWWDVERPAWAARHHDNHRLAGVVAQIKWGVVGSLGVAGMKKVVMDELRRRDAR